MNYRKLRFAWSVLCGFFSVLLIMFWVWGEKWADAIGYGIDFPIWLVALLAVALVAGGLIAYAARKYFLGKTLVGQQANGPRMDDHRTDREDGSEKVQFSLTQLLLSASLIAVAMAVIATTFRVVQSPGKSPMMVELFSLLFFVSGPLIGLGLFLPLKKPLIGVLFGVVLQALLCGLAIAIGFRSW